MLSLFVVVEHIHAPMDNFLATHDWSKTKSTGSFEVFPLELAKHAHYEVLCRLRRAERIKISLYPESLQSSRPQLMCSLN